MWITFEQNYLNLLSSRLVQFEGQRHRLKVDVRKNVGSGWCDLDEGFLVRFFILGSFR